MMRRRTRFGYTLLEIVLALALTSMVMFLVAGAINFHLKQLTLRRVKIEEAQLGRAILRQIANDLRAVIVYRPVDFSSVNEMTELVDEAAAVLVGDAPESEDSSSDEESMDESTVDSTTVPTVPGLYGNQYELQIDMSRIPRYEEYELVAQFGVDAAVGGLSDLKTVSYYVSGGGQASASNSILDGTASGGLVRQVVSRAESRLAMEFGGLMSDLNATLLAPEVMELQFAYFDGYEWTTEWDSQAMGGIPMAVEIILVLQDPTAIAEGEVPQITNENIYRLVVQLPGAEPYEEEEEVTIAGEEEGL